MRASLRLRKEEADLINEDITAKIMGYIIFIYLLIEPVPTILQYQSPLNFYILFLEFIHFSNNQRLLEVNQITYYKKMCGNEISTVSSPNGDFYQLVATQIPTRKIGLKNYPINSNHTMQLSTLNLAAIRELSLQKCKLNHESVEELSRVRLPVLTKLNLNDNQLGPIGCRILASSPLLSRITELYLNNNKIKDVGLKALSSADLLAIEDLSLNDNSLTSQSIGALKGKLQSIQCLSLGGNKLNDKSIAQLNEVNPGSLYFLKLSRNEITDEGLRQLINEHKNLEVLLIQRNKIKQGRDKYASKNLFLFY